VLEKVLSTNGIRIRLTDERWAHITEEHCELAGLRLEVMETVTSPARILAGKGGEFMAVREISPGRYLVVPYREVGADGFIITAFITSRVNSLNRRVQLWPR
jgi:hypothetical protein